MMTAVTALRQNTTTPVGFVPARKIPSFVDPLDQDEAADDVVVTTRRAIMRVALVAAETAGRFQRDAVPHDPMTWMLAPRRAFDGEAAIDACLDRDACIRGILIHGLGLGLDVERSAIDALLANDGGPAGKATSSRGAGGGLSRPRRGASDGGAVGPTRRAGTGGARLYTATVIASHGPNTLLAFHASVATGSDQVRKRIADALNPVLAAMADIAPGFDPTTAAMIAAFPAELTDLVRDMELNPSLYADADITINVRQVVGERADAADRGSL